MWWWTDLFCEWEMFVLCLLMLLCLLWEVLVSRGNNQSKSEDSWATWIWGRWLQVIILFQAFWSISIEIHILNHFLTNCLLIFTIINGVTATIIYPVIITRAKCQQKSTLLACLQLNWAFSSGKLWSTMDWRLKKVITSPVLPNNLYDYNTWLPENCV